MVVLGKYEVPAWMLAVPAGFILLYKYGTWNYGFWKKQGIQGPRPYPFIGNLLELAKMELIELDIFNRKKYGKTYGIFNGTRPMLLTCDQDLISEIMVKQFQYFQNRVRFFGSGDKLIDNMLTMMEDDVWKQTRSIMSPTFTTGKLRQMADEINRSAKLLAHNICSQAAPFETREKVRAYTMDVIASTAFGLRLESQGGDKDNVFFYHANKIIDFSFTNPVFLAGLVSERLAQFLGRLGFKIFDKNSSDFFLGVLKQALDSRSINTENRSDFVQLMVNARKGHSNDNKEDESEIENINTASAKTGLTDDEVLSNALIFFLAGFDTTSIGLTQLLYNLAINPDCQEKVHEEIESVIGSKAVENVTYDDVMKMHYLDQCMQESLRLYPPVPRFDRICSADVEINGIKIPKGCAVAVPVYAVHMDHEIWKNPDQFDPDRFSTEEKAKRSPLAWLPFGYGPRNCIGMRLALYELKVAVVHILQTHRLITCSKTENPITWESGKWLKPKNGIWLATEKRSS